MYFFALQQLSKMAFNWIDMYLLILLLIHLLWLLHLLQGKPRNCAKKTHICVSVVSEQEESLDLQDMFPSLTDFRKSRHRIQFRQPL